MVPYSLGLRVGKYGKRSHWGSKTIGPNLRTAAQSALAAVTAHAQGGLSDLVHDYRLGLRTATILGLRVAGCFELRCHPERAVPKLAALWRELGVRIQMGWTPSATAEPGSDRLGGSIIVQ
jgi:hypothetical protein